MTPRVKRLLRQAKNVEELGKRSAAETLYRELAAEAPDEPDALLGIARLTRDADEQKRLFDQVIVLDPKNEQAWAGLAGDWLPAPEPVVEVELEAEEAEVSAELTPAQPEITPVVTLPDVNPKVETAAVEADHIHDHDTEQVGLTCNKCGKPIDMKTAQHTPVGYRCKACVRELEDTKFYTIRTFDYVIAALVALPLSLAAGYLPQFLGWLTIFLAAAVGTFVGTATFRAIGKRRGRYIPMLVAVCVAIGGVLPLVLRFFTGFNLFMIIWPAVYTFIATSAAYYRLR